MSLETVKKLAEFADQLDTTKDPSNNILTNLCDGLETFLGFNKDSKGYDGSGIVYSDLDRLCDGVMGFLSGVLGAVKDDPSVKTYDIHRDNNFTKAIETIKNSMHKPGGLSEAVKAVSEALGEWDGNLTSRTKYTIDKFKTLTTVNISNMHDAFNALHNCETNDISNNLSKCYAEAERLQLAFQNADKQCTALDAVLYDSIQYALRKVEAHINKFVAASTNKELRAIVGAAKERLIDLECNVHIHVEYCLNNMTTEINTKFDNHIHQPLEALQNYITSVNNDLQAWLLAVENVLQDVLKKAVEVHKRLDPDQNAKPIGEKIHLISDTNGNVIGMNESLKQEVENLCQWKKEAEQVVDHGKSMIADIVNVLDGKNGIAGKIAERDEIKNAAATLKVKAEKLRNAAYESKQQVQKLVDQALGAVKTMDTKLRENLLSVKSQIKSGITDYVKQDLSTKIKTALEEETDKIAKRKGEKLKGPGHLDSIVESVQRYVKQFGQNIEDISDGGTLGVWIDELYRQNEQPVRGWLEEYYKYNSAQFKVAASIQNAASFHEPVKKEIVTVLKSKVYGNVQGKLVITDEINDIAAYTGKLQSFLTSYAVEINNDMGAKVDAILESIERALLNEGMRSQFASKSYMKNTIRFCLQYISQLVRQIASEIKAFTSAYLIDNNLKQAMQKVVALGSWIQTQLGAGGVVVVGAGSTVKLADDVNQQIASRVNGTLGEEENGKLKLSNYFNDYKTYVDTSKATVPDGPLQGTNPSEGSLPVTIKSIQTQVEDSNYLGNVVDTGSGTDQFHSQTFSTLLGTVNSRLDNFTKKVKTLLHSDSDWDWDLEDYFNKIGSMLTDSVAKYREVPKTLREVHDALSSLQKTTLPKHTGKIAEAIEEIKINLRSYRNDYLKKTDGSKDDVITRLDDLLNGGIKATGDWKGNNGVRSLLDIQKRIATDVIGNANDNEPITLSGIINKAIEFYTSTIRQEANNAVSGIEQNLKLEVANATNAILNQGRKVYLGRMHPMFKIMKYKVTGYIADIEKRINMDLQCGIKGLLRTMKDNEPKLNSIKGLVSPMPKPSRVSNKNFTNSSQHLQTYVDAMLTHIEIQVTDPTKSLPNQPPNQPPTDPASKLTKIKGEFENLLTNLIDENRSKKYNYDNKFVSLLASLKNATDDLSPSAFANPRHPELLDAVRQGLKGFVEQMGKVYVNGYDGDPSIHFAWDGTFESKLSDHGKNCCKVFLTVLEILSKSFMDLQKECIANGDERICLYNKKGDGKNAVNALGAFFVKRGYKVNTEEGKQTGELQDNRDKMKGELINKNLISKSLNIKTEVLVKWKKEKDAKDKARRTKPNGSDITLFHILEFFFGHLERYYKVRHLEHISSPKVPRNIYQMLQWLNGLRHNTIYTPLRICIKELFPRLKEDEAKDIKTISPYNVKLSATSEMTYVYMAGHALTNVSMLCHDVLVAIQGHGHAGGRYACDFSTNDEKLLYPNSGSACFDMFVDIVERVFHQLRFVYGQCCNGTDSSGWADCWYGQGVGGSGWICNTKQCPNQNCPQLADQNADQRANQSADQTCDSHPKCGLKSPLQSFLEDGLQGFLPHSFTKPGCKLECTVSNHRGLPCKTPMGFGDIASVSSHTKRGEDLREVLEDFCGNKSHLRSLSAYLMCLLQKPPQTLGDMFAFYYNFVYGWNTKGLGEDNDNRHRKNAFDGAVTGAYFGVPYDQLDPSLMFSTTHSNNHKSRDLFALICPGDDQSVTTCGRYLQPIGLSSWTIFSEKYADKYLSWVVYNTETFYSWLSQLYRECCSNCDKSGTRCHGKLCPQICPVKYTSDEKQSTTNTRTYHIKNCKSIAQCPFTRPTLCKYGFVLKSFSNMSGANGDDTKRTCKDLCNALKHVLSDKETDNAPLAVLVYRTIPEFLFKIREPFIWLNVALWLLSLLYLLHIMVIRLDLLHIKSHLHSPSSHRIAAQSLLAAGRVNKLNRVFYLQP